MPSTVRPAAEIPLRVKGCCEPVAAALPEGTAEEIAAVHRALGDPTRVQMVHMLAAATQPICVCDFAAVFDLGQPTISHHLGKLRAAGLVTSSKRGVWAFYRLNPEMPESARRAVAAIP